MTRQFPSPTGRFYTVCGQKSEKGEREVKEVVPEAERRQAHLKLIPEAHSLKPLALQCLQKEYQRPSAMQLSERLSEIKISPKCIESMPQPQSSSDIHQDTRQQLQTNELMFQQSLQQKDNIITELEQTISAQKREIQQLELQLASRDHPQQQQLIIAPQATVAAAEKDMKKMKLRKGKNAPATMSRGAAVVHGNRAYFRPHYSGIVYVYENVLGEEAWCVLTHNPTSSFGLAVVDGILTSVGGYIINALLSLIEEGNGKEWSAIIPPMPTARESAACVTTEQVLVVAGGQGVNHEPLDIVEVMSIRTKQWSAVSRLPQKCSNLSGAVFQDMLYMAGGPETSKSVFTCSLPDLWSPTASLSPSRKVWKEIDCLPVDRSSLVQFGGQLLAIGGRDDSGKSTSNIYRYDPHSDSWTIITHMKNKRSECLAVTPLGDYLLVVGGVKYEESTDSVEILK